MSNKRYPEEFKIEVVKQITEQGYKVHDVANRLGISTHSIYIWLKNVEFEKNYDINKKSVY